MIIGLGRPKTRNPEILFYLNKRAWKFELEGLVQEPFPLQESKYKIFVTLSSYKKGEAWNDRAVLNHVFFSVPQSH